MDALISLLEQGTALRLLIFTFVIFFAFIGSVYWSARNRIHRRKAKKEGLPPPPGMTLQIWRFLMGLFNNLFGSNNDDKSETNDAIISDENLGDLPLPALDFPALDFPATPPTQTANDEDIDTFLSGLDGNPASAQAVQYPAQVIDPKKSDTGELNHTPIPIGTDPERTGMMYVAGSGQLPEDAVEVMRVWRDINDGSLIIQIGDRVFQTMSEMRDRGMAKRFIALVQNLAQVATIGAQVAGLPKPNFEATSNIFSAPGAWSTPAPTPSTKPITPTQPTPAVDLPATGSLGIVSQINRYLQKRLDQTPVFVGRKIKMSSASDGTLEIWVDAHVFGSVGEIRDREVREFIQRILTEWENAH